MPVSVCIIHLNVGNGNEKTAVAMFNHVYSETMKTNRRFSGEAELRDRSGFLMNSQFLVPGPPVVQC